MSHIFRYTNPLTSDPAMSMRDHQILKVGDAWYLTGTSAPYWKGFNPGVRLFKSSDLLNWTFVDWLVDASKLPDEAASGPPKSTRPMGGFT
jgi:xylan 1,4-beta-xylosidase